MTIGAHFWVRQYETPLKAAIHFHLKKIFFFFVFMVLGVSFYTSPNLFCQTGGFKFLKNYTPKEYDRQPQNWAIIQDKRGIIYVGNQGGLVEFDGITWRKIEVPNRMVRSMAMDDTGTIYIGGNAEFGYLKPELNGSLMYEPLLGKIKKKEHKNFQVVWKTYSTKEGIYFQSNEFLFLLDSKSKQIKNVWAPDKPKEGLFHFSFVCKGQLFIRERNNGLKRMVNNSLEMIPGGEIFAEKRIYVMVPYHSGKLLIGTRSHGFYTYDGKRVEAFPTEMDDYLIKKQLCHGIQLRSSFSSGDFALATLRGGLVIMDSNGRLKDIFTKASGLQDDNVKYIFEDSRGNLWLGLDIGLAKIEYASPIFIYDDYRSNLPGLILSVTRHSPRNDLYVGTSRGLYALTSPDKFRPVPGISSNCWDLLSIGDSLLAATTDGVFQVENKHKVIGGLSYTLLCSQKDTNRVWVGTRRGLASLYLKKEKGLEQWIEEHKEFKNITTGIRTIVEQKNGNLWLGTFAKGVFKVDFRGDKVSPEPDVALYDTSHGLPPGEVNVFMAAGHVMFATKRGIFKLNEASKRFIPDLTFGEEFANGSRSVFRIVEDQDRDTWFHSKFWNFRARPRPDGSYDIAPVPVLKTHIIQVNAIYPDPDGDNTWFAGNEGLIRYDTTITKDYRHDFPTLIRQVLVNKRPIFNGYRYEYKTPVVAYQDRNLHFKFAAPFFVAEAETQYRCLLQGYDDNWSNWSSETQKEYTNLDSGLYAFQVQARNAFEHKGRKAVFQFKVLPPWYKTFWAFLSYALLAFLLISLIIKWRSWKLEREKQTLEQIVKDRTKEVNEKNRQLEKQTVQLKDQSEKLKEMDRVKSRFFANISHEFRTPLTLIIGPLEQMLSGSRDKAQKKQLKVMIRNSQRLLTLINQLLDLSRFDSGKMRLQASYRDIISFLKGLLASFELAAAQNKLELQFFAEEEEIFLYFDPEKLELMVCNLLINAVKFTPTGGKITVTVKRSPIKEDVFPSGSLEIMIRDTGIGIPKDQLSHIFDRFYQAKGPNRELLQHDLKGTGIGLALTKEVVNLHHGRIDVHSRERKDTKFIIRLPMGKEHLKTEEIISPSEIPSSYKKSKISTHSMIEDEDEKGEMADTDEIKTAIGEEGKNIEPEAQEKNVILVVEDNAEVRNYIRRPLEPPYKVVEAADGKEGIKIAKKIIPDLIISDIMMPEVDGYQLCSVLKNDIKTSHIPIILLTAKASEESIIQGLETGADDYITKPFSTKILAARIKNLIDLRRHLQLKIQRQKMLLPAEIQMSSIDEQFLKEFQKVIEKNLSDPDFNIDVLAKKLYMGRTTLFRKVQALTGEPPNQFIQSYRLERAAQLLKTNFGNITEVSFEVGFNSTAYFTKCFKEKFHQLPSTFQASEGR